MTIKGTKEMAGGREREPNGVKERTYGLGLAAQQHPGKNKKGRGKKEGNEIEDGAKGRGEERESRGKEGRVSRKRREEGRKKKGRRQGNG